MSSLNRAMDRKMASVTQQIVELLHDSPLPSLDDIREDIATIKSFVKDIKSEVKNIEVNQPNTNHYSPDTEEPSESNGDDPSRGTKSRPAQVSRYLRDRIADWLEDNWRHRLSPGLPDDNAFNELIDLLRGNERLSLGDVASIIALFYFDRYADPFDLLLDAKNLMPQLQLMRADVSPTGPLSGVIKEYNATTNELVGVLEETVMGRLSSLDSDLSEQIGNNAGNIISDIASLRSLNDTHYSNLSEQIGSEAGAIISGIASLRLLNDAYLPTIYDKIVECCVVDDVQSLLRIAGTQSDNLHEVLQILRAGGSPALLSQNGAILSGLKAVQAELATIRGLL